MGVMYTACFDASGHEQNEEHLVVAGFLSSGDDWIKFDSAWTRRLAENGLPYLHMREFAHKLPPFDRLTEKQRRELLSDLMDIIQANAYRKYVSVVVNKVLRDGMPEKMKQLYYFNSYVYAGRNGVAMLAEWMKSQKMAAPLRLIFAKGDAGEGDLRKRLEEDGYGTPEFRYPVDKTIEGMFYPGFIPLQACDFLAYESFKAIKAQGIERWGFETFISMPGQMGIVTENDLRETTQWIDVNDAVTKWIFDQAIPVPKGTKVRTLKLRLKKKGVKNAKTRKQNPHSASREAGA
jgi:hypothetical protein